MNVSLALLPLGGAVSHTSLPEVTHRVHGRWTSQLRWALLQLTQAEAT